MRQQGLSYAAIAAQIGRTPKQTRSRYINRLAPGLRSGPLPEAERQIARRAALAGIGWAAIARDLLPNWAEYTIKNGANASPRAAIPNVAGDHATAAADGAGATA